MTDATPSAPAVPRKADEVRSELAARNGTPYAHTTTQLRNAAMTYTAPAPTDHSVPRRCRTRSGREVIITGFAPGHTFPWRNKGENWGYDGVYLDDGTFSHTDITSGLPGQPAFEPQLLAPAPEAAPEVGAGVPPVARRSPWAGIARGAVFTGRSHLFLIAMASLAISTIVLCRVIFAVHGAVWP